MPHQIFKVLTIFICLWGMAFSSPHRVNAQIPPVPGANRDYCSELEEVTGNWNKAPAPQAIICPVIRVINVFVLSAGAIFVVFVFISAIKYALSQGDPKALQASQQTLTMAIVGFLIVIGVYTLLTVVKNVLGLQDNQIIDPFSALKNALQEFLNKLKITVN